MKGKRGPTPNVDPQKVDETVPVEAEVKTNGDATDHRQLLFICPDCGAKFEWQDEAEEHATGTGHGNPVMDEGRVQW